MNTYEYRELLVPFLMGANAAKALALGAFATLVLAASLCFSLDAAAANFSFEGAFSADDDVAPLSFVADGSSVVTMISYGYGGGTLSNGIAVDAGGFDTVITLFDSAGLKVIDNDDASNKGACTVGVDPATLGLSFDACLNMTLAAGNYIVAVTQFDNKVDGDDILNGFQRSGGPTFTTGLSESGCENGMFCDSGGNNRTNKWALDVLNVEQAAVTHLPEPTMLMLMCLGLAGLGLGKRLKRGT